MKLMRVLDKKMILDKKFQPELILTIAFSMETVTDESEVISTEEFVKLLNEAIEDYDKEVE
jgi:hypothetical protein